jgi:hypothetical protein
MAIEERSANGVDWRLQSVRKNLPGRKTEIEYGPEIVDTLFFLDANIPTANPTASIERALSGYWRILAAAAALFTPDEWKVLTDTTCPLHHGGFEYGTAASAVSEIERDFPGEDWRKELLAVKRILPKLSALSQAEFEAVREILYLIRNVYSDDQIFTVSQKLTALTDSKTESPKL